MMRIFATLLWSCSFCGLALQSIMDVRNPFCRKPACIHLWLTTHDILLKFYFPYEKGIFSHPASPLSEDCWRQEFQLQSIYEVPIGYLQRRTTNYLVQISWIQLKKSLRKCGAVKLKWVQISLSKLMFTLLHYWLHISIAI